MPSALYFLSSLSGLALLVSAVTHFATFFGSQGPFAELVPVMHIGIFILMLPTILVMNRLTRNVPQRDLWKAALRGCPSWMRYAAWGFFGYAGLNFTLFAIGEHSGAGTGSDVRGISGHWMAFYSVQAATLYSAARLWHEGADIVCTNGHKVSPLSKFCDQCGQPVSQQGPR